MSRYSSPHDTPYYSDPDYDDLGRRNRDYTVSATPIGCAVCGDVEVAEEGDMCDFCSSPEQIAERAEWDAYIAGKEAQRLVMQPVSDMPTDESAQMRRLAELSDVIDELRRSA